jgi:5-methylcytosine-specific restriction endonuclease McrA
MKNSPLKRRKPLKRKTPLRPVSKLKHRREKRFIQKDVIAEVLRRSQGTCEVMLPKMEGYWQRCDRPAQQIHHLKPRGRGGSNESWNLKHICFDCHRLIHDEPLFGERIGMLIK